SRHLLFVTPAKAGVHPAVETGFRRYDELEGRRSDPANFWFNTLAGSGRPVVSANQRNPKSAKTADGPTGPADRFRQFISNGGYSLNTLIAVTRMCCVTV